ncbi:hypothetical protein BV912_08375 [Neisseria dumasiana]|uniref:Lipoprotein signal peptidase n=1 Tax=Neisseria dumasiana TaxID=1931275 RepID=A0A1X3DGR6_9NEIS|nr:hypothetical protein BV912_08375 [Neisseria dumasiana]
MRAETFANPHLRRISALCAARSFAYLYDMSALAVLLRLELHLHLRVLQRSRAVFIFQTRKLCKLTACGTLLFCALPARFIGLHPLRLDTLNYIRIRPCL